MKTPRSRSSKHDGPRARRKFLPRGSEEMQSLPLRTSAVAALRGLLLSDARICISFKVVQ
jgi:hypothetical protein